MSDDPIKLEIDPVLVKEKLVEFLQTEFARAGYKKAVVGLSGGIDSALSCILAAEALGPENVLAVRMPYKTSSPGSLEHAQLVVEKCGVQELTIPITEMVDAYLRVVPEAGNVRSGNVMARTRMIILYDQSADFNGLVVGTGNKTEILLGYTTLYGDSACAINPIGDLYKTQVRQLSAAVGVPEVIITKPPSADLWEGQTDEEELGVTYKSVDRLLYLLIEHRYSLDDCIKVGFDKSLVEGIISRIRRNHFKRILPPIAKVSDQSLGYAFPYLLD